MGDLTKNKLLAFLNKIEKDATALSKEESREVDREINARLRSFSTEFKEKQAKAQIEASRIILTL